MDPFVSVNGLYIVLEVLKLQFMWVCCGGKVCPVAPWEYQEMPFGGSVKKSVDKWAQNGTGVLKDLGYL